MDGQAQASRSVKAGMVIGWLGPAVLAASLFATVSLAGDSVKIGSLLADPDSYKLKIVQVEGIVRSHRMSHFIGSFPKLEMCAQHFLVADDTGAVKANYTTVCAPGVKLIILRNGDRVTAEGNFSGAHGAQALLVVRSVTKH